MDYDVLDGVPCHVLGRTVKTRTQIFLSILLPASLELIVYLFLTTADAALSYQHFHDGNKLFGILTLTFLCLPALVCFCSVVTSAWYWPDVEGCGRQNWIFFSRQLLNLIIFPIGAIYRYGRRIFWSIEALFHDRDAKERRCAVRRAYENSPFELYHFCQAFFQAAPQIILQLYHMLREDMFRNFETTTAQTFSLIFSFITMGVIISSYQRFESQKCVGRNYPWCTKEQVEYRSRHLRQTKSIISSSSENRSNPYTPIIEYPNIQFNINLRYNDLSGNQNESNFRNTISNIEQFTPLIDQRKTMNVDQYNFQGVTDDEKIQNTSKIYPPSPESNIAYDELDSEPRRITGKRVTYNFSQNDTKRPLSDQSNVPDDDLMEHIDEIKSFIRKTDGRLPLETSFDDIEPYPVKSSDEIESHSIQLRRSETPDNYDSVPKTPPPPRPSSTTENHKIFGIESPLKRISLFKDMLVQNTEMYIKEHVPRLPAKLFEHDNDEKTSTSPEPVIPEPDEPDLFLPSRRTMVEGIEQDDFFGKMISFMGWGLFLLMRMLSLSTFSVFYLIPTLHILYAHYIIMVVCLFYETRFQEKMERIFFYLFLGYIYIFSILEFKIKFKHLRQWYIGYVGFVFAQNIILTMVWYGGAEFTSWWFHYIFAVIIGSGVLSIGCLLFYYFLLKPQNKIMLENK